MEWIDEYVMVSKDELLSIANLVRGINIGQPPESLLMILNDVAVMLEELAEGNAGGNEDDGHDTGDEGETPVFA